jgi:hypothetical protein
MTDTLTLAREVVTKWYDSGYCEELITDVAFTLNRFRAAGVQEERERCAKHIEALAINIRDNGPKSAEGLLTAIAGAHVGALLDAAISLRLAATGDRLNE